MPRYAQIENGKAISVILWDGISDPPFGLDKASLVGPVSDDVAAGATYDAGMFTPGPKVAAPKQFFARDMLALMTTQDFAAVQAAISQSPALFGLWASLQAQGDAPISTDAERFQQGWAGLSQAIGQDRATAIAASLGIT